MAVTIKIPALWRTAAGGAGQVDLPAGSLADVLNALVERLPSLGARLFDEKGEVRSAIDIGQHLGKLSSASDSDPRLMVKLGRSPPL